MRDSQNLSHTKWDCKYHLVFIPKRCKVEWLQPEDERFEAVTGGYRTRISEDPK